MFHNMSVCKQCVQYAKCIVQVMGPMARSSCLFLSGANTTVESTVCRFQPNFEQRQRPTAAATLVRCTMGRNMVSAISSIYACGSRSC